MIDWSFSIACHIFPKTSPINIHHHAYAKFLHQSALLAVRDHVLYVRPGKFRVYKTKGRRYETMSFLVQMDDIIYQDKTNIYIYIST